MYLTFNIFSEKLDHFLRLYNSANMKNELAFLVSYNVAILVRGADFIWKVAQS